MIIKDKDNIGNVDFKFIHNGEVTKDFIYVGGKVGYYTIMLNDKNLKDYLIKQLYLQGIEEIIDKYGIDVKYILIKSTTEPYIRFEWIIKLGGA